MDTSHLGSTVPTIPDVSTTLLCPKLFWMTSDLISLEVLMGFTFSMVVLLALFHFKFCVLNTHIDAYLCQVKIKD